MTDKIVVFSACENMDEAAAIGKALVEKRLAACVNIVPGVRSIYHWKGALEEASEVLLIIKTGRPLVADVLAEIERLHSYELPEMIALQIVDGSERYLDWIAAGLRQDDAEPR